jgi:DNA-binding transcriptional LysR family regulator
MELRHLRVFVAIAETGSLRAAAEALRVVQPALSRTLSDLERELGVPLLVRQPRGVTPTEAGRAFLADARRLLAEAGEAAARARRIGAGLAGEITLGFIEAAAWAGAMPAALAAFRADRPAVTLSLRPMPSAAGREAVREGRLDGAFCYYAPEDDAELLATLARQDRVCLAIPSGHALAAGPLRLAALADAPWVMFPRASSPGFHDDLMRRFLAAGISPRIVQEAPDQASMLALVSAGIGIAPVNDATRWRRPASVLLRPCQGLDLPLPLSLVTRRDSTNRALKSFIRATAAAQSVHLTLRAPLPTLPVSRNDRGNKPQGQRTEP